MRLQSSESIIMAAKKHHRVIGLRLVPLVAWLVINLGLHQVFRFAVAPVSRLASLTQETSLAIWFAFLFAATLANFLMAYVETRGWRVVFIITGILTPISGVLIGTLGMGYVLYAPQIFLQFLVLRVELVTHFFGTIYNFGSK